MSGNDLQPLEEEVSKEEDEEEESLIIKVDLTDTAPSVSFNRDKGMFGKYSD